ncbi:class I SAM-dependent methyltransferase [Aspergillus lucknowensis]|uniref:Methyltransferase domain-containing protein n=1 Tax=Aspergillus lucknowensis TaxID=176173 RepID=A0ABR4LIQ6_9EURO
MRNKSPLAEADPWNRLEQNMVSTADGTLRHPLQADSGLDSYSSTLRGCTADGTPDLWSINTPTLPLGQQSWEYHHTCACLLAMGDAEEIYPLARDKAESTRLNNQHKLVLDASGGAIDPSIPLNTVSAVADVATGTGVWLYDARKQINETPGTGTQIYYHGFDISAAQFPENPDEIEFSVHDILKPFPAEHHNRYDLVNVKFLVAAFPESQYPAAVNNLLTILKPGGYLQWIEFDFSAVVDPNGPARNPRSDYVTEPWVKFLEHNNLSLSAPEALETVFKDVGLAKVKHRSALVRGRDHLKPQAREWLLTFFTDMMPLLLLKSGIAASQEQAESEATRRLGELAAYLAEGEIMDVRFGTVVGQKL